MSNEQAAATDKQEPSASSSTTRQRRTKLQLLQQQSEPKTRVRQSSMEALNNQQQQTRFKFLAADSNQSSGSIENYLQTTKNKNTNKNNSSGGNNYKDKFTSMMGTSNKHRLIKRQNSSGSSQAEQLLAASNEGQVDLVRLLLRSGADVNSQESQFGNTPLHQAAWNGFSQTVEVLCKYRANTSIRNKAQFTPLHLACQQGHNQTIRLLLMANAKTEAKNSYGDTPLHTAARYGHAGAARILLSAKCDPNQVNKNHDTPLHIAAAMGRRKLTKIFMQNGAEPAIKNKQNETPMDIALKKDLIDIQELIANPPPIESSSRYRRQASSHRMLPTERTSPSAGRRETNRRRELAARRQRDNPLFDTDSSSDELDLQQQQRRSKLALNRKSGADLLAEQASNGSRLFGRELHNELAVDVPDEWGVALTSARSMGALAKDQAAARRLRTRTLGASGTDLQLGGGRRSCDAGSPVAMRLVMRRRSRTPADAEESSATNLRLLPDAKPLLEEWNELAAKRIRETPTVIEEPMTVNNKSNGHDERESEKSTRKSPSASLRSSLSKSRGKLLLNRRNRRAATKTSLVRRPNLGTCVGKLSLLKLRKVVNQRQLQLNRTHETKEEQKGEDEDEGEEGEEEAEEQQKSGVVVEGRRQERLKQQQQQSTRAPNGTRLVATRLLAPLDDETQLYAIPKKTKQRQQQTTAAPATATGDKQQVASVGPAATCPAATSGDNSQHKQQDRRLLLLQQDDATGENRTPSGGPALTSDGGQSSCSSSSSLASNEKDSSRIASSSDECIGAITTGPNPKGARPSAVQQSRDERLAPALVGVHGLDRTDSSASHKPDATSNQACLCQPADDGEASKKEQVATAEQTQTKNKTPSRLRQFLHLGEPKARAKPSAATATATATDEKRRPHTPISAIAGGYYAYSPGVQQTAPPAAKQSPSNDSYAAELATDDIKSATATNGGGGTNAKRTSSWIRGKLSLASNQTYTGDKITSQGELAASPKRDAVELLAEQQSFKVLQSEAEPEDGLIRPKGALSATSADLIAAQKSLAAAAAAKVKRDRMAKIMSVAGDEFEAANKTGTGSLLTVKTCEPTFWPTHHHRISLNGDDSQQPNHHQQTTVSVGKPFVLMVGGQPMSIAADQGCRSGANSVGMSDSSPSNNGAESDNSIQTTSGSVNTASDNTSQNTQQGPTCSESSQSNSSPLGILSRILLNNKNFGRPTFSSAANNNSSSSTDATLVDSPSTTTTTTTTKKGAALDERKPLDQLASRSRRPIVLTKSNDQEPAEANAPQLPPKSALNLLPAARCFIGPPVTMQHPALNDPGMNGLPRVASCTQLANNSNSNINGNGNGNQLAPQQRQPLCDYHAFARHSHYNSNSNGNSNTRSNNAQFYVSGYGSNVDEANHDPMAFGGVNLARSYSTTSHHDLRSLMQQHPPTSVINYEYYLEPSAGERADARYHYHNQPSNDNSIYPRANLYAHDDSIYVQASSTSSSSYANANASSNANQIRDPFAQRSTAITAMHLDGQFQSRSSAYNGQHQQQQRPKSSLDTFLLSSMGSNHRNSPSTDRTINQSNQITSNNSNNNGRQQSNDSSATTATTITNGGFCGTKGNPPVASGGSNNILQLSSIGGDTLVSLQHNKRQQRRSSLSSSQQQQQQPPQLLLGCSEYFNNSPHLSQPAAAYYSPFIHHNGGGNTINGNYSAAVAVTATSACDQHQSNLTVLPAPAATASPATAASAASKSCQESSYHRKQSPSSPSIEQSVVAAAAAAASLDRPAAAAATIVVAEGGDGLNGEAAADNEPTAAAESREEEKKVRRTEVNGGDRRKTNSWTPAPAAAATYKSLVHINQSSPPAASVDKSNQSSAAKISVSAKSTTNATLPANSNGTGAAVVKSIRGNSSTTVLLTNGNRRDEPKMSSRHVLIDQRPGLMGLSAGSVSCQVRDKPKKIDYRPGAANRRPHEEEEDDDDDEECDGSRSTML